MNLSELHSISILLRNKIYHMSRYLVVTLILLFYFLGVPVFGQGSCDPALPGIKEGKLGYRDRGDRCEGLYINPVSNTTLFLASFTEQFENYDNSGNTILIEWDKPPTNKEIILRAQGIKPRLYYR